MATVDQLELRQNDINNMSDKERNIFKKRLNQETLVPGTYQLMPNTESQIDASNESGMTIAQNGVSNSSENDFKGLGALDGTLGGYIPQAQKIYSSLYSKSKEQQEKEDRMNTGMMMLNFFTKMGAEASRPGATALGSASLAGADTASMYIKQVNADRARKDAEKKGVVGLASQLMTSADTKALALSKAKKPTFSAPIKYEVKDANAIRKTLVSLKLSPLNPDTQQFWKKGDTIPLTNELNSKFPIGSLLKVETSKSKVTSKLEPFGVVDTAKFTLAYPLIKISPNGNVLLTPEDALVIAKEGFITEKLGEQIAGMSKPQFDGLDKLQGNLATGIKTFNELQRAYDNIRGFYKDQYAINDYGLAVGFAKILDPTSVARESEVQSVATAGAITTSVKAQIINAFMGTGKLSKSMRQQIYNSTLTIYSNKLTRFQPVLDQYKENAEKIKEGGFKFVAPGFKLESKEDVLAQKVTIEPEDIETTKVIVLPDRLKVMKTNFLKQLISNAPTFSLTDDDLKLIDAELATRPDK